MSVGEPLVTVLMTVHNGLPWINDALASLRAQTHQNLEIVVVDDGSDDGTVPAVQAISAADPRVRLFTPGRIGRGRALNYGLAQARGDLVAVNDADDISYPLRIERQVGFLAAHPDHGLVGTYFRTVDVTTGESELAQHPTDDAALRLALTRGPCFSHSAVMYRRSVATEVGAYDASRSFLFDREFFVRMAARTKIATVPELLVDVTHHGARHFFYGFSAARRGIQHNLMRLKAIRLFGMPARMYLSPLAGLASLLIPPTVRASVPAGLRARIRQIINPGGEASAVVSPRNGHK